MYQSKNYRTKYNAYNKIYNQINSLLKKALSFEVKDVYVKVDDSRTNAYELGRLLYQLIRYIEQAAKINAVELERPYHEYVAFWWLWDDEWPDDWFRDYPKWPPSYDKMRFDSAYDEASFLMYTLNAFIEERLNCALKRHSRLNKYYLCDTTKSLNDIYFIVTECYEAFNHFITRWKRVNKKWGSLYSGAHICGWHIDYDD